MATPASRFFLGLIPWYGLLIVFGIVLAIYLSNKEAETLALPKDTILDLSLWLLPIGILGARIYYVFFSWISFRNNLISVLFIWEGGLAIYGGLIAGAAVLLVFCQKRKLPIFLMFDIIVPGVALAQAVGRWGNYFNQEAYGLPLSTDSPFSFFPVAVLIQEGTSSIWHLATFFYESSWDFIIFFVLLWGRRRWFRKQGDVFLFYLLLYSAGRLVIENLRMDSLYLGTNIRISQLLSFIVLITVIFFFWYRKRRQKGAASRLIVFCFSLGLTLITIYALFSHIFPDWNNSMIQVIYLAVYSLLMIISSAFIYGRSDITEVQYAHH